MSVPVVQNGNVLEQTAIQTLRAAPGSVSPGPTALALALEETPAAGVLEVRLYRMHDGHRDAFATFFANETLTGQREAGMRVVAQFLSLDDPSRFRVAQGLPGSCQP